MRYSAMAPNPAPQIDAEGGHSSGRTKLRLSRGFQCGLGYDVIPHKSVVQAVSLYLSHFVLINRAINGLPQIG